MKSNRWPGNGNSYAEVDGDEFLGGDGDILATYTLGVFMFLQQLSAQEVHHMQRRKLRIN